MRSTRSAAAELTKTTGKNPLDTTFGPHSRRAEQIKTQPHGGILEISDSALSALKLSTISNLGRIAEKYPDALKYFPSGSHIVLYGSYTLDTSGDWGSSSYYTASCALKYPAPDGSMKTSGKEEILGGWSEKGIEGKFESFLQLIQNNSLDLD